ncbi:MAG: hypothetical protein J7L15_03200 [Clostridiales bacterium]|nr:hypothetical protein [Clostridiales bacterium]
MKEILDRQRVGKPQEPDYNYQPDTWYNPDLGFDSKINYSELKVITPKVSKLLWDSVDQDMLQDLRYFAWNVQKKWEVQYNVCPEEDYIQPEAALGLEVEYFGFWVTADDRLRYICENITTNPDLGLIDQIGNGLASHFYGARNVHTALTGIDDPKKALVDYTKLAKEQNDYLKTGEIGEYTQYLRVFLEQQKSKGIKFWGTTELHTSIQTGAKKWHNHFYHGDREDKRKSRYSTNQLNEWLASWKNSGLVEKMIDNSGLKAMCELLGTEWGVGDYYKFHGGSDLSLCPDLNAYLDERYVIPGPGASWTLEKLYPGLSKRDVSYEDRVIWMRENQETLLGLPVIDKFFHKLEVNNVNIFPELINEIKTTQAEVLHCQFGIYCQIRNDPKKIAKRKVARNLSCLLDAHGSPLDMEELDEDW